MSDRIQALLALLARNPGDGRAHFGLAAEYEKRSEWAQVISHLSEYLSLTEDQGNAWGRLANAQLALGQTEAAAQSYQRGIDAARRHGHPSMAAEFEAAREDLLS
jgi:E3 SUMO-protein ligase RanBP2